MAVMEMVGKFVAKKAIYMAADLIVPGSGQALKGFNLLSKTMSAEHMAEAVGKLGVDRSLEIAENIGDMQDSVIDTITDWFV